ncbi:MAG: metallophosphoesterase [Opitutaceae bacterium]
MKFLHTADWQIGKPFAGIRDEHKRSLVQHARTEAIKRIDAVAKDANAEFVVVAGDLFDSPSADKSTVSAACSAIGQMGLPVFVIPGNHDHGGPGSVWNQDFFKREQAALAPNLTVLLETTPHDCGTAILLPCPLLRRSVAADPTEWLRNSEVYASLPPGKPRIVIGHGSTQAFSSQWDDDEEVGAVGNLIDLARLPDAEIDFFALGDWHGTKKVHAKAWFAGTPELDRFAKGGDHDPGNILLVQVERGGLPQVVKKVTASLRWNDASFDFSDDSSLSEFQDRLTAILAQRANEDLLKLTLTGSIGIEASARLDEILESLDARLLRLKLTNQTRIAPTETEIDALTTRASDPLIANVAGQLVQRATGDYEDAQVVRIALRELHAACMQEAGS